jgi:signal transduction histidine kinase
MLDDLGLAAAVEWQVRRTGDRTGMDVQLALACDEARISPEVRTAAFRIVQESLTNLEKHARARRCSIALITRDGALTIEIQDDGVGLGEGAAGRGNGLVGMRERAQALGGTFEVAAPPQGGTRVRATLPLAAQARAAAETGTETGAEEAR